MAQTHPPDFVVSWGCVTASGVSAAGVTLTLASAAAGDRRYITALEISKFNFASGTASALPNRITTTNLPGGMAFIIEQSAGAAGTNYSKFFTFTPPLATISPTADTTIVAPAQGQSIWHLGLWYV